MLRIRGLSKQYPGVLALDRVDFEVAAGEVHALVGENGAGKSTLVKILGGAVEPDSGDVALAGRRLPLGSPVAARRAGVAIIYQEFSLAPELSAAENIFLGREQTRFGLLCGRTMRDAARAVLERLGCNADPAARVESLSVGVRQQVEIARALAFDARLLVFDEPSATLTDQELSRLFETIRQLRAAGLAIIYISHRLEEIFALADRVTVLRDGRHMATAPVREVDRAQLIRWMVGRDLAEEFPPRAGAGGDVALEVRGLAARPYFHEATFDVRRGEIVGLAGLVGAGRTSLGLALGGGIRPTEGTAMLDDRPMDFGGPWDALDAGVGYLTEDRKGRGILEFLSVAENITISNLPAYRLFGLLAEGRRRAAAQESCSRFRVKTPTIDRPIRTLSGGNQQKALLARLMLRPLKLLILDEPTRGIDVGAKAEVYRLMNALAAGGLAVLMISSELPELLGMCDRIVVMREGRTVGELPRGAATQERIMDLATGGSAA
ncbi:MAG: sugar ABC transporter ATP-binding protein [Phycisphaerae bacterium]|nr:sugar ABC transporter ATP-binding protein [Phycisphaerae bacterium]